MYRCSQRQDFGQIYCLSFYTEMEKIGSPETLVIGYHITWRHITASSNLRSYQTTASLKYPKGIKALRDLCDHIFR